MDREMKEIRKKCFIITPIGDENSDIFRKARGVIDTVIKPILLKYEFNDIKPAYEIMESGMISNQIINRIINDDLVVANLTGNNPNVMYELAIRHAVAKPIIHICEKGTDLSFDIKDNRTIFYKNDLAGAEELKRDLENYISSIDYSIKYSDNPIYNAVKSLSNILINKEMQVQDVELCFELQQNEEVNNIESCIKTSPSGYSIKIFNIGEKPFYLERIELIHDNKIITNCVFPEEKVVKPYEYCVYDLTFQEYNIILLHCRRLSLKRCDAIAYEVGGKHFSGEIELFLPYIQCNNRNVFS